MNERLHTPVCDLLGCDRPIVLAGMGGVARSELVAAVTKAGAFGFLGMVRESPELIRDEIAKVRAATDRDFGVNLIPAATPPALLEAELEAVIGERVPVVALFWDLYPPIIARLRSAGIIVVCQVGDTGEAKAAERAGAHVVIAQGFGAGGHVRGTTPLAELLPQVTGAVDVPVLAAGGLNSGADLADALALGAQGIVLGTAFLATNESFAHDHHKQRIVESRPGETVHTDVFYVNWPRGAYVRVLPNSVTRGERGDPFAAVKTPIGKEGERTIWLFSTDSPLRSMDGELEAMAIYAGEGAGAIRSIVPAAARVENIVAEADALIAERAFPVRATQETALPASPVCYAAQSGDSYLGFATCDELLVFLNELLEAERAGARVAARMAADTNEPAMKRLLQDIRSKEARWCAMLLQWIARMEGTPSSKIGAFYEKCLAIPDLAERLAFLNRGQAWVMRKLHEWLPKIRDDAMHADFTAMLKSHEDNIARTNAQLKAP